MGKILLIQQRKDTKIIDCVVANSEAQAVVFEDKKVFTTFRATSVFILKKLKLPVHMLQSAYNVFTGLEKKFKDADSVAEELWNAVETKNISNEDSDMANKTTTTKKVAKKTSTKVEKKVEKKEAKAKTNGKDAPGRGRKSSIDGTKKINLLVKENPKRKGTKAFKKWEQMKQGETVTSYLARGGTTRHIKYCLDKKFLALR